jgi:hypothetical protein
MDTDNWLDRFSIEILEIIFAYCGKGSIAVLALVSNELWYRIVKSYLGTKYPSRNLGWYGSRNGCVRTIKWYIYIIGGDANNNATIIKIYMMGYGCDITNTDNIIINTSQLEYVCRIAIGNNHLSVLEIVHEFNERFWKRLWGNSESFIKENVSTSCIKFYIKSYFINICSAAAEYGNLEVFKWVKTLRAPILERNALYNFDMDPIAHLATVYGHPQILGWIRANGYVLPGNVYTVAVSNSIMEILTWMRNDYDLWDPAKCRARAIKLGKDDILKWLDNTNI